MDYMYTVVRKIIMSPLNKCELCFFLYLVLKRGILKGSWAFQLFSVLSGST
jgi:hypothetical protein